MADIAKASPRIVGLNLGTEDFALDCGMEATPESMQVAKQHVVFAARAARILPLGVVGSMADFGDVPAFREMVQRSRRFGFAGASCIHPAQVSILNELFAPSPEEVEAARRTVGALAAAEKEGRGATALDGRMIDAPVAESARRVLERHDAIAAVASGRATIAHCPTRALVPSGSTIIPLRQEAVPCTKEKADVNLVAA